MKRIILVFALLIIGSLLASGAVIQVNKGTLGYQGLSTDTKPTNAVPGNFRVSDIRAGMQFEETDTGLIWIFNGTAWYLPTIKAVSDTTKMTAPGTSAALSTKGFQKVKWNFTIYNKDTSVTIGLQERDTKSAWRYVEATIVYTANGDYGLVWAHAATADSLRLNWSAEVGGTAAIVTENVVLSGGGE